MFTKRRLVYPFMFSLFFAQALSAEIEQTESAIEGVWIESHKQKMAVRIEQCDQEFCGYIYWLKNPNDEKGLPKLDSQNPDSSLQNRPQCGLKILSGFTAKDKDSWSRGKVYNPKDGNTFNGTIKLTKDGDLKVRGYIGISLFGKTLNWQRLDQALEPCH